MPSIKYLVWVHGIVLTAGSQCGKELFDGDTNVLMHSLGTSGVYGYINTQGIQISFAAAMLH